MCARVPFDCTRAHHIQKAESFALPPVIAEAFDRYADVFHTLKAPRKLLPLTHYGACVDLSKSRHMCACRLGTVDVDVTLGDAVLSVTATPLEVTLLMAFEEQPTWNLNDLAARVDTSVARTSQALGVWYVQHCCHRCCLRCAQSTPFVL